tara:strand:+ start:919 stop:1119 length:201 start_codon:yes stop_codon:yes gene_type:complete
MTNNYTFEVDNKFQQKLLFIYNALENGWEIKKSGNKYILKKENNEDKEVYLDNYLDKFIKTLLLGF